jgi:ferredoxin-NADP reductase
MRNPIHIYDDFLNGVTMYKQILFGLAGLLLLALVLAATDVIGISPWALGLSITTLVISSYVANTLFGRLFKAQTNSESWLITALILACIITPTASVSFVGFAALAAIVAMASKYVLVWRGGHVFNPAAVGAFALSVGGGLTAGWWIATPWLLPYVALLALGVLRKQRQYTLFTIFAVTSLTVMLAVNGSSGMAVNEVVKNTFLSWPLVFLGSIMLTEPLTLPAGKYNQWLVGGAVGALFASQLSVGGLHATPHAALLVGNLLAAVLTPPLGATLQLKSKRQLANDITEVTFKKPRHWRFLAGQYADLTLAHAADIRGRRRTFSIASAPAESNLMFTFRTPPDGSSYKRAMRALPEGALVRASNIAGSFVLPPTPKPLLFIAGGIGITPFRSMVAQLIAQKTTCNVVLLYLASDDQHFVYRDVFERATPLGVHTEYRTQRVTLPELTNIVPDLADREVYISGPESMVRSYKHMALTAGAQRRHIHTDRFTGY